MVWRLLGLEDVFEPLSALPWVSFGVTLFPPGVGQKGPRRGLLLEKINCPDDIKILIL